MSRFLIFHILDASDRCLSESYLSSESHRPGLQNEFCNGQLIPVIQEDDGMIFIWFLFPWTWTIGVVQHLPGQPVTILCKPPQVVFDSTSWRHRKVETSEGMVSSDGWLSVA